MENSGEPKKTLLLAKEYEILVGRGETQSLFLRSINNPNRGLETSQAGVDAESPQELGSAPSSPFETTKNLRTTKKRREMVKLWGEEKKTEEGTTAKKRL